MLTRKAPYHYGWDWGPRFVTSGIWRPVALEAWDGRGSTTCRCSRAARRRARGAGHRRARGRRARRPRARDGGACRAGRRWATPTSTLKPGVNDVELGARIEKPERWWPNGLGPQRLYTLETTLTAADGGARRARDAHRPAHDRGRAPARRGRQELRHQGQRRAGVHEGRELDPRRQLRHAHDRRALPLPAAVGRRRQHEHAAGVGRRHLRGRSLLRSVRRAGPAGVAGLHVRLQHVPGRRAVRRQRPPGGDRERPPPAQPPQPGAVGGQQRDRGRLAAVGLAGQVRARKKAQDRIWADYKRMFHELLPAVVAAEDPGRFYTRSSPSANDDKVPPNKLRLGRHALLGRVARRGAVRGVRRQHLALHERVRLPVVPRAGVGGALHGARRPTGTSRAR